VAVISLERLRFPRREKHPARPAEPLPAPALNDEAELVDAPPPSDRLRDDRAWWRSPYGAWRLDAEREAMRRFPGFKLSDDPCLHWRGWLEGAFVPRHRYLVYVVYPAGFPDEPPEVTIARPQLPSGMPHLLPDQRPCLFRGSGRAGYEPGVTTAATLVAWTALWIHAFETWRETGRWPGRAD
jgi:hypothetical protein